MFILSLSFELVFLFSNNGQYQFLPLIAASPLHAYTDAVFCRCVRELVKRNKMVVNDEDEDSNTPLHLACLAGHAKVVRTLIEAGADIEARNCTLWTPLDCAAARGWLKTVRVLLEADAPVDPLDRSKVLYGNFLLEKYLARISKGLKQVRQGVRG